MVDHLQSRVTPWRQYASHVKVRGTLSKMDVTNGPRGIKITNLIVGAKKFREKYPPGIGLKHIQRFFI